MIAESRVSAARSESALGDRIDTAYPGTFSAITWLLRS